MSVENEHRERVPLVLQCVPLGNSDRVADCVDTEGDHSYWYLRPLTRAEEHHAVHGSARNAPHEDVGPLPQVYLERLVAVPLRCGRTRRDGHRCRIAVVNAGIACYRHQSPCRDEQITHDPS
jgi:hypothetical protein